MGGGGRRRTDGLGRAQGGTDGSDHQYRQRVDKRAGAHSLPPSPATRLSTERDGETVECDVLVGEAAPSSPPSFPPPHPQSTPRVPGSLRHGQDLTYLPLRVAYRVRGRCGGEEDLAGGHGGAGMRATRAPGVAGFPGPASRHGATPCSLHPPAPRHLLRVRGVLGDHPAGRARQAHAAALPVPQRCSRRWGAPPPLSSTGVRNSACGPLSFLRKPHTNINNN